MPDVWIDGGLKFVTEGKDPGISAKIRWCTAERCVAEAEVDQMVLTKFRTRTEPGQLEFKEASQQDVAIPVSFKGFAEAVDWMQKQ